MTQLQTFDDTQKLIQKYGTRDPFELIDVLPNTKLWPARSLDADGLRGFGFAVPPIPATVSKFPPFCFYDFENGGFVGGAAIRGAFPQIQGNTDVTITLDCELGYARFIMNDVLAVDVFECTDV